MRSYEKCVCVCVCVCPSLLDDFLQVELSVLHLIQVLYGHLQVPLCLPSRFLHLRPDPLLLLPAVLQLHTHPHIQIFGIFSLT